MVKRKLFIILLGLSLILLGCGMISAMISVEVDNSFETGIVDISVAEYQKVGGREELWEDNPTVLPGDVVSKIPRVHNDGNDCYIRAKITIRGNEHITESNLLGISDLWHKAKDGYYYYTEIVPHGEDIDIFQAVSIPVDLPNDTQGQLFHIDIDVDAIQSANFMPEFNDDDPWGSIEILKCGKEGQYDISTFKPSDTKSFKIEYRGDAKKLIKNSDDFFANIPYLMPGDTYSDKVQIINDGAADMQLYFRSAADDPSDLLDKIQLTITTNIDGTTKTFYQGNLRAEELSDNITLGTIPAGAEGTFDFVISVPVELNNEYTIQASQLKWIFSTEFIEAPDAPATGDMSNIHFYVGLIGISLLGIGVVLLFGVKRKAVKYNG